MTMKKAMAAVPSGDKKLLKQNDKNYAKLSPKGQAMDIAHDRMAMKKSMKTGRGR